MELEHTPPLFLRLPDDVGRDFYGGELPSSFHPAICGSSEQGIGESVGLFSVDLARCLAGLDGVDLGVLESKSGSEVPMLWFTPDFSLRHVLFHYDGAVDSTARIRFFLDQFRSLIGESRATIISPSFIPKSKIREEQEMIEMVASATSETSFIKFNFAKVSDFWSYGMRHDCSLLVTARRYQRDLATVLSASYKGKRKGGGLSFYISS